MKNLYVVVIAIFAIAGIVGLIYGGWWLKREINYNLMYKSMVQETVREMVKESALK
jgi:hypothetical protein